MTSANITAPVAAAAVPEPWKSRSDWASGKIRSSQFGLIFLVLFTLFWNAISWTVAIAAWNDIKRNDRWAMALVSLFPAIGIFMALVTLYTFFRRQKFGVSVFEMASVPGVIGGPLAGVVEVPRKLRPAMGFIVKLNCIRHYQKGEDSQQDLLWQDEQLIGRELFDDSASTTAIPIQFAIPYELRESEKGRGETIQWLLEVLAQDPGIDYHETFDVPVFRTEASSPDFQLDEDLLAPFTVLLTPETVIREANILHEPTASGGDSFIFPAMRAQGPAIMLTGFLVIWIGAIVFMTQSGVPIFFPIVFGLFALLLIWGCLDLWLRNSRIEIDRDEVVIRSGWLGFGRPMKILRSEVASTDIKQRLRSGTHAWFDVRLVTEKGDELTFGRYVHGPRLAKAVADLVLDAIRGRQNSSAEVF